MNSLGNDFIVINGVTQYLKLQPALIKRLCHRNFGIGADQLLLVEPPIEGDADFYLKIFNADGSSAANCVNGLRCVGRFVCDHHLIYRLPIIIDFPSGRCELTQKLNANVNAQFNFIIPQGRPTTLLHCNIQDYSDLVFYTAAFGNNHAVCYLADNLPTDLANFFIQLTTECPDLKNYNISLVTQPNKNTINMRVHERGVGETLACGSAAIAACIVGQQLNLLENTTTVKFKYGDVNVTIDPHNNSIIQSGSTRRIYSGEFRV